MLYQITNWDEADKALKELAEIKRLVDTKTNTLNQKIDDKKTLVALELQPMHP